MRQLRSLGYQSDLLVLSLNPDCLILEHDDRVIQAITPGNPGYYWGNLVVFPGPPGAGDVDRWCQRFRELFAAYPDVRHISIGWDDTSGEQGEVQPFLDDGFKVEALSVMTATRQSLHDPLKGPDGLVVRPLVTDGDWEAATALQIMCGLEFYSLDEYEGFKRTQMAQYRRNSDDGHGHWYGAFLDGRLVADLGIFCGDGVGRFQSVETHPEHRRQGLASRLVYEASRHTLAHFAPEKVTSLVIVAESGAPAMRMYEGVGYRTTELQVALCKPPPSER